MKFGTHCKFCKKPITLEIDENYDALGDPQKLIPMACCNYCADIRELRRKLERKVQVVCTMLELAGKSSEAKSREALVRLTKDYATMISKWTGKVNRWDEAVVDALLKDPHHFGDPLTRMWKI